MNCWTERPSRDGLFVAEHTAEIIITAMSPAEQVARLREQIERARRSKPPHPELQAQEPAIPSLLDHDCSRT